jgi:aspartyl-tRNA(Asn)/glutamyl-tRNA(Gln) amidotransferase subunit B
LKPRPSLRPAKLASNWIMGEMSRRLNAGNRHETAPSVAAATGRLIGAHCQDGTISNNAAKPGV